MKSISVTMLALALLLIGCGEMSSEEPNQQTSVSVEEAKQLVDEGQVEIIDVRTLEEYADGHLKDSKLIPLNELESRISEFKPDQSYLLVCRSGNRSKQAQDILREHGILNTYNMSGGMIAWLYDTVK